MRSVSRSFVLALWGLGVAAVAPSAVHAQTGVSDDRVSLPDGPGSLDGMGDNASTDGNMGQMSTSIPIVVPDGFASATPDLALRYSSGAGQGVAGIGWSMSVPFIERMTSRGLPEYTADDRFVVGGSEQLVAVSAANDEPRVFRTRFEGAFVRYAWHDRGAGDEGYWTGEFPDGTVAWFGADELGVADESTRVRSIDGIFRFLLSVTVDRWGHKVTYDYSRHTGTSPLLDVVGWAHDARTGTPLYTVTFTYEAREDVLSDARGGFNDLLTDRLTGATVETDGVLVRRYAFDYQTYDDTDGISRLGAVRTFGSRGGESPVRMTFDYSKGIVGGDPDVPASAPFLVTIGNIAFNALDVGQGTLMDMNGDSLPDLVVTPVSGDHQIYLSQMSREGVQSLAAPYSSGVAAAENYRLGNNLVQELDFDGDGFADLVNYSTGNVLVNRGEGTWAGETRLSSSGGVDPSDFADAVELSAGDGELENIKFFDYDGDRRMDLLKTVPNATTVLRSLGGGGYVPATGIEDLGASFGQDNLELADMNGDGLLDPVRLQSTGISFKLNLGRGQWTDTWLPVSNALIAGEQDLPFTSLEDLNGDGIDDIVFVQGSTIKFAINRAGQRFEAVQTISAAGDSPLPVRDDATTVLFADMNGNGSNDVVWVEGNGDITYLELFPVRPNLLTRIDNGVGAITEIGYSTSVLNRARNPDAEWTYAVPTSMIVVDSIDRFTASGTAADEIRDLTTMTYSSGFYDGAEKQWRGFERIVRVTAADDNQDAITMVEEYDIGAPTRPAPTRADGQLWNERAPFAGLLLQSRAESDGLPFRTETTRWALCTVADLPPVEGLDFPIEWACATRMTTLDQERRPAAEWVETVVDKDYDGYGNTIVVADHGVTSIGSASCAPCVGTDDDFGAPCGATCLGDELIRETDFVDPVGNGAWMLRLATEARRRASDGGRVAIERFYYDGTDFEGLPPGQATRGGLTRTEQVMESGVAALQTKRMKLDVHGNVIEEVAPSETVAGGKRRTFTYSADGLDLLSESADVTGATGSHRLRRDYVYDPLFDDVASSTEWYIDSPAPAPRRSGYDEFGRLAWIAEVGDSPSSPTKTFTYDDTPGRWLRATRAVTSSGDAAVPVQEEVTCEDGRGRLVRTLRRIDDARWLVDNASVFNRQNQLLRLYDSFESTSDDCEGDIPAGVAFTAYFYDGLGREIRVIDPSPDADAPARERRVVFAPLSRVQFSADDNTAGDPRADTPAVLRYDGLERVVSAERTAVAGQVAIVHRFHYDDLANLAGYTGPDGRVRSQTRDLAGRIVSSTDPDRGELLLQYDERSLPVREEDAAGRVTLHRYDEVGREVERWDDGDRNGTLVEFFYDRLASCPFDACDNGAGELVGQRVASGGATFVEDANRYDARRRLVEKVRVVDGKSYGFAATYDNADDVADESFPDGRTLRYERDAMGRLTAVPGYVEAIEYNARGLLAGYTLHNGTTTVLDTNVNRELVGLQVKKANDALVDLRLARDPVGNVTAIEDRGPTVSATSSQSAGFGYDALQRLLTAELGGAAPEQITLGYDDQDRIVEQVSSASDSAANLGAYRYDDARPRALAGAGGVDWTYDAAGYAQSRGDDVYAFSNTGKLASIVRGGEPLAQMRYDADDDLVALQVGGRERVYLSPAFVLEDGIGRLRVSVGGRVVVEEDDASLAAVIFDDDGDGVITAADAWAHRDDESMASTLRTSARRLVIEDGGARSYLHHDHQGSTIAVSDEAGTVAERFSYFPFGQVRFASAGQTELAAFVGATHDATGVLHMGARTLSPREGRWLSADPAFSTLEAADIETLAGAMASYSYADNNPATFVDTTGFLPFFTPFTEQAAWSTAGAVAQWQREDDFSRRGTMEGVVADAEAAAARATKLHTQREQRRALVARVQSAPRAVASAVASAGRAVVSAFSSIGGAVKARYDAYQAPRTAAAAADAFTANIVTSDSRLDQRKFKQGMWNSAATKGWTDGFGQTTVAAGSGYAYKHYSKTQDNKKKGAGQKRYPMRVVRTKASKK